MNRQWSLGIFTACILALGSAWAMGWFAGSKYSNDAEVAKVEKMRDKIVEQDQEKGPAAFGQIRKAVEGMTDEQRKSFMESSMPIFVRMGAMHMEKRFDEFLVMSLEEQRRELDKKIDEQLARQKKRKAEGGDGDRPRRGPPNVSPEKRDEFRKKMQDWTTPEQRAKFQAVMGMYNERREERSLEPIEMGRWR